MTLNEFASRENIGVLRGVPALGVGAYWRAAMLR